MKTELGAHELLVAQQNMLAELTERELVGIAATWEYGRNIQLLESRSAQPYDTVQVDTFKKWLGTRSLIDLAGCLRAGSEQEIKLNPSLFLAIYFRVNEILNAEYADNADMERLNNHVAILQDRNMQQGGMPGTLHLNWWEVRNQLIAAQTVWGAMMMGKFLENLPGTESQTEPEE